MVRISLVVCVIGYKSVPERNGDALNHDGKGDDN
jgi:hypothetical protein